MIRVTCAECGQDFEIGDDFAGITEFCPSCGALNDIPGAEPVEDEPPPPSEVPLAVEDVERPRGGIPAGLWWTILIGALILFGGACLFLFSDNWESQNVEALSDATNRGDDFMADENYINAASEYQYVLNLVGHRKIESAYIQQLVDRARNGIAEADARRHATAQHTPATAPSIAAATHPAATTQGATQTPVISIDAAMGIFQRNEEAFPGFVRSRPTVFRDKTGAWRRRRYVVWGEQYDPPELKEPLRVSLRYNVGSQVTDPHFSRVNAAADDTYTHDESPRIVHCETFFLWIGAHWTIARREVNAEKESHTLDDVRPSLDDFVEIERQAFGIAPE